MGLGLLGKILEHGAEIAATVVEKGLEEAERIEQRRREIEKKAADTVEKVVGTAIERKEEFDRRAEKKLGEFISVLGELLGAPVEDEPQATVQPLPEKLEKPTLKAPKETVVTRPEVTVVPETAVVAAPKKRAGGKKRPSGKKLTR